MRRWERLEGSLGSISEQHGGIDANEMLTHGSPRPFASPEQAHWARVAPGGAVVVVVVVGVPQAGSPCHDPEPAAAQPSLRRKDHHQPDPKESWTRSLTRHMAKRQVGRE